MRVCIYPSIDCWVQLGSSMGSLRLCTCRPNGGALTQLQSPSIAKCQRMISSMAPARVLESYRLTNRCRQGDRAVIASSSKSKTMSRSRTRSMSSGEAESGSCMSSSWECEQADRTSPSALQPRSSTLEQAWAVLQPSTWLQFCSQHQQFSFWFPTAAATPSLPSTHLETCFQLQTELATRSPLLSSWKEEFQVLSVIRPQFDPTPEVSPSITPGPSVPDPSLPSSPPSHPPSTLPEYPPNVAPSETPAPETNPGIPDVVPIPDPVPIPEVPSPIPDIPSPTEIPSVSPSQVPIPQVPVEVPSPSPVPEIPVPNVPPEIPNPFPSPGPGITFGAPGQPVAMVLDPLHPILMPPFPEIEFIQDVGGFQELSFTGVPRGPPISPPNTPPLTPPGVPTPTPPPSTPPIPPPGTPPPFPPPQTPPIPPGGPGPVPPPTTPPLPPSGVPPPGPPEFPPTPSPGPEIFPPGPPTI